MKRVVILLLLIMLIVAGQIPERAPAQKKAVVMREWSRALRQMGIVPIYPPREDVYVGDIYVYPFNPEGRLAEKALDKGDLRLGMSPRFGSLVIRGTPETNVVLENLTDNYLARPIWPATPQEYANMLTGQLASTVWGEPAAATGSIYTPDLRRNRLRLVGFPEFLSASFSGGDLNALVPTEAFKVGFGFSWNKAKSVTVKIPAAESYSLPIMNTVLLLFAEQTRAAEARGDKPKLKEEYAKPLRVFNNEGYENLRERGEDPDVLWVRVITEVYYARVMDISLTTNKTKGVQGQADLAIPTNLPGPPTASNSNGNNSNTNGNANTNANSNSNANTNSSPTPSPAPTINMQANVIDRAAQMNQRLTALGAQRVPGGAIGYVSASDSAITMRRVWQYPIALGFRGLLLKVNRKTGEVLGVLYPISDIPTR